MKSEQEMQFADPDWKPTGPLVTSKDENRTITPTPISVAGPLNYQTYDALPPDVLPLYEQGYRGNSWQEQEQDQAESLVQRASGQPFVGQTSYYAPDMMNGRRRSHWWIWLLIVVLLLSLIGGMSRSFDGGNPGGFHRPYYRQGPIQHMQPQTYDLKGATQVNISDPTGSVMVQTTSDAFQSVQVNTDNGSQPQLNYQGSALTIAPTDGGDILVIVPQGTTLNLNTGDTPVEVDSFTGQLTTQTNGGQLILNNDTLGQGSVLTTNSGSIDLEQSSIGDASITSATGAVTLNGVDLSGKVLVQTGGQGTIDFNGTLRPQGHYQFTTASGYINLSVPYAQGSVAQWQIAQKSGHYLTDFLKSTGNSSQLFVGVTTNNGDITINQQ